MGGPEGAATLADVQAFIEAHETADTTIAVDAPLIIRNETGRRPCEAEISRRFGKAHAGAHPSNRSLYPEAGSVQLALDLIARGYRHCPEPDAGRPGPGRWICEVYPHPAHVVLFERDRIIKYKRGRVAERRRGLGRLRRGIRSTIFSDAGPFRFDAGLEQMFAEPLASVRGRALKRYEDRLDAILCAYVASQLRQWGWARSEMFGDTRSGYIVVPTTPPPFRVG